ncbi:urease accessory protein D [Physcomitrium patens]|uniref:Urease accessory protein D n=1 Tax=Physcomitrium patens TaxID=3218 RepID=A9S3X6_PHYPA|nr:urease accessory protein D-like [Physcomitrium patens]PNR44072.1 hypothetical protein PHYPA_016455 [Physcomitrium patens]|eukprot:XP_024390719.1 urease accessory protein D-like [Physcomitrella patens]
MAFMDSGRRSGWEKLLGPSFKDRALTGVIKVDNVAGKSAVTRTFAKYPLKFLLPNKIVPSGIDAVWIYAISYGGGIVSNDSISQRVEVGPSCTAVITTQSSTKIYKSVEGKFCEQILQAYVGREGFFAVLPDPITCFKNSKYTQVQEFYLAADANLVLIDWMTSGRVDNGESWEFELYKSINHIYLEDVKADCSKSTPLFLDCLCLEQGVGTSVAERMRGFHVVANMVIYGPKLAAFRVKVQKKVQELTQKAFTRRKSCDLTARLRDSSLSAESPSTSDPLLFVSCSSIGPANEGLVVRAVASTTALMYDFFKEQLAHIDSLIGACPYAGR